MPTRRTRPTVRKTRRNTTPAIVDATSGDTITGRIGPFTVTNYRRNEAGDGIFEGRHAAPTHGSGRRSLIAELRDAARENRENAHWRSVVSLYDPATATWWPVRLGR